MTHAEADRLIRMPLDEYQALLRATPTAELGALIADAHAAFRREREGFLSQLRFDRPPRAEGEAQP
jgi:hypothetical protein